MGTIKADTIVAADGTSPVTLTKQSAAKSWCHIDGEGTPVISGSGSFNVSSLGDLATGLVSANFTNSMADDDFSHSFTTRDESFIALMQELHTSTIRSTSRCVALCHDNATTAHADCDARSYTVHGDLA
jgi:hypothetical protein